MRKIADTTAQLSAIKARSAGGRRPLLRPNRLRVLMEIGSNPGELGSHCYVPKDLPAGRPLVVVLHGCTQTAASYDYHSGWSQLADEAGFALLYPEQQRSNNPNLCFNWFVPGDTQRHLGEVCSIRQMIEAIIIAHDLDRARVFVTGLSAGGAMAAAILATYPELFAGGAIIAGLAHGIAKSIPEAFERMQGHGIPSGQQLRQNLRKASDYAGPWPRLSIWQGTADRTVAPSNAEALVAQWRGAHQLDHAPTKTESAGALVRQIWRNRSGKAAVELNMIAGMGHGTPISSDLGHAGPFMLDVGICSTREIARLWGLLSIKGDRASISSQEEIAEPPSLPSTPLVETRNRRPEAVSPPAARSSGVQKTIEDALRAARLLR